MRLFKQPRIDFIGPRRRWMLFSLVVILAGMTSVVIHGGFNTSIDFAGGTLVEIKFVPLGSSAAGETAGTGAQQEVPLSDVRDIVEQAGFSGAEVTHFGSADEVLVKVKNIGAEAEAGADSAMTAADAGDLIAAHLKKAFQGTVVDSVDVRRVESVGPKIGNELKSAAFLAIVYSLLGIVVYISWRFEFRFAIAAILALVHDVLITLGFFSVTQREVSIPVIAAILTIVGYSLNDTIVVFDRIREDLKARKREGYAVVVNASINETLSRTTITSFTTLIVVLCLVIWGGEVIKDFALTLMVGVIVGTYSSIFIASPILVEWENWRSRHRKRKK